MRIVIGLLLALAGGGCASRGAAQTSYGSPQEPIRGDYRKIAACVFKALDPMSPGHFQIATLPEEIIITFQTTGGGLTFRDLEASFSKGPGDTTLIDVKGRQPGYYPQKVRPLAAECAAR